MRVLPGGERLVAITDEGSWLVARLVLEDGVLRGLAEAEMGPLRGEDGLPLAGKSSRDAESLDVLPDGSFLVGFEREHRIMRYPAGTGRPDGVPTRLSPPDGLDRAPLNGGIETIVALRDGRLLLLLEEGGPGPTSPGWIGGPGEWRSGRPCAPNGRCGRPTRRCCRTATCSSSSAATTSTAGSRPSGCARFRRRDMRAGAVLGGAVLAELKTPLTVDNFEGVSAWAAGGETRDPPRLGRQLQRGGGAADAADDVPDGEPLAPADRGDEHQLVAFGQHRVEGGVAAVDGGGEARTARSEGRVTRGEHAPGSSAVAPSGSSRRTSPAPADSRSEANRRTLTCTVHVSHDARPRQGRCEPTGVLDSAGGRCRATGSDREIDYLRISVIDHCNLRCVYCMPLRGLSFVPSPELLTAAEIETVVRAAVEVGFRKFRLTGGEPTLRPDIVEITSRIAAVDGVRDLAMTTNGILLPRLARPLREAGLRRLNVHLDTLDPERLKKLMRFASVEEMRGGHRRGRGGRARAGEDQLHGDARPQRRRRRGAGAPRP